MSGRLATGSQGADETREHATYVSAQVKCPLLHLGREVAHPTGDYDLGL